MLRGKSSVIAWIILLGLVGTFSPMIILSGLWTWLAAWGYLWNGHNLIGFVRALTQREEDVHQPPSGVTASVHTRPKEPGKLELWTTIKLFKKLDREVVEVHWVLHEQECYIHQRVCNELQEKLSARKVLWMFLCRVMLAGLLLML